MQNGAADGVACGAADLRTPTEQLQADLDARNKMRLGTSSTQPTETFKRPMGE